MDTSEQCLNGHHLVSSVQRLSFMASNEMSPKEWLAQIVADKDDISAEQQVAFTDLIELVHFVSQDEKHLEVLKRRITGISEEDFQVSALCIVEY